MVGDGMLTRFERLVASSSRKVHRLKDGRLLGAAGKTRDVDPLIKWLDGEGARPKKAEVSALLLSPGGKVELIVDNDDPIRVEAPAAVGSGSELAIGAMLAGASPRDAVLIAASRDPFTGGELTEDAVEER
jgi:ATP-dependent protease HslVU (ClpYQ) peptidase subunit